jgi:hypothetical protein
MKKTITALMLGIFMTASIVIVGGSTAAAAEPVAQTKRKQQNVGVIRQTYRGGKKAGKATYRGGRYVTVRTYRGGKWVTQRVWQAGKWVTVKTANGTKRVFRRSKQVIY